MNTMTLKRIRRLLQKTELTSSTYIETPLYAIEMLVYLALYQDDHPIHASELCEALKVKPDKVLRALRQHLCMYVQAVNTRKEGVKGPVKAFYLTTKGKEYILHIIKEYETVKGDAQC